MGIFTWFYGEPPKRLKVKQVYAVAFSQDGRVLVKVHHVGDKTDYNLIGGKPEKFDKNREDTLRREYVEEVNTTLKKDVYMLGYQEVNEGNGVPIYAQIRMVAMIDKIGEIKPDPDGGEIYERLLVPPKRAIDLLGWGEIAEKVVNGAVEIAKEKFGLKFTNTTEERV